MPKSTRDLPLLVVRDCYPSQGHSHDLTSGEEQSIRINLLKWYDQNKRDLPWRRYATEQDGNKRSYAVWVSEIMLQQTQVSTVIDYYKRWMEKWPTIQDLAEASLEEVNEVWSGLGYYSRARRLYEGCKKVCEEMDGNVPSDATSLQKKLPGVGRYTAGAIASIAFKEATGVVDGNVIRVLSRLRLIGADSTSNSVFEKFWQISNSLVDDARPGDFNQAMMELGATLCMPKTPHCTDCPLRDYCMAYKQVKEFKKTKATEFLTTLKVQNSSINSRENNDDIEECNLCLSSTWDESLGVCNYPVKPKKKEAKQEVFGACLVQRRHTNGENSFVIVQRPESGLLAGLWEFPNTELEPETTQHNASSIISQFLSDEFGLPKLDGQKKVGEVFHKFSHRHHTYKVYHLICQQDVSLEQTSLHKQQIKWVTKEEFKEAAMPTAMRKIFKMYEDSLRTVASGSKKRKLDAKPSNIMKNQKTMESFLKTK